MVDRAGLSEITTSQLEIVEVLEDVFNGDLNNEHASGLTQFDDLSEAYYTLGDYYMQDGYMKDALEAKERAILLEDEALQIAEKEESTESHIRRLKIVVEHFANLGYLYMDANIIDKASRYYEASTVRSKQAYGEESVDYAMTLVPSASALLAVAERDSSSARATLVLEKLTDEMFTLLRNELGDDHEVIQEASHIIEAAKVLAGPSNDSALLEAALGYDDDDEMELPLPDGGGSPTGSQLRSLSRVDTDSLVGGGNSISTLGLRSAVSFEEGTSIISEHYHGGKDAAAKAANVLGAFGGTRDNMLAMINSKGDTDAEKALLHGDRDALGYNEDDIPSLQKEDADSLKTTMSRAHQVVRSVEVLHDTGDKLQYSVDYLNFKNNKDNEEELLKIFQREN